jgi:uncharacterized protein YkwD
MVMAAGGAGTGGAEPPGPGRQPAGTAVEAPQPEPVPQSRRGGRSPQAASREADALLRLVNRARSDAGCPALETDPALTRAAQGHASTMAESGGLSHIGAGGSTPGDRATDAGYPWRKVAENLARGHPDAPAVTDAWLHSSGHRAAIVDCAFRDTGIGYRAGRTGPWWVQTYAVRH